MFHDAQHWPRFPLTVYSSSLQNKNCTSPPVCFVYDTKIGGDLDLLPNLFKKRVWQVAFRWSLSARRVASWRMILDGMFRLASLVFFFLGVFLPCADGTKPKITSAALQTIQGGECASLRDDVRLWMAGERYVVVVVGTGHGCRHDDCQSHINKHNCTYSEKRNERQVWIH